MTWKDELARYERHLKGTNRRASNRASILGYLQALGERYKPESFLDLEPEDISGFIGELRQAGLRGTKGLAENTLKSILSRIRTFIRFLGRGKDEDRRRQARDLLEAVEPRSLFVHPKITPRVKSRSDLLTPEDMERFLSVCDGGKRTIFLLLWWTGCRPTEILRQRRQDIDFQTYKDGRPYAVLSIRDPKTQESRDEFLARPEAIEALRKWIQVAPENEEGWLFRSPYGGHLKYQALWAYMKRKAVVAGLKKNCYPYLLRHGAGTRRYEAPPEIWKALQGSNQRENYIHLADEQSLDWVMENEAGPEETAPQDFAKLRDRLERIEEMLDTESEKDVMIKALVNEARLSLPRHKVTRGKSPVARTEKILRQLSEALGE